MSQFKFKEYLYNLLPLFFHDSDTYKDQDGKGILQRFLEVCSEYLDSYVSDNQGTQPGLDNIVDLIDIDKTPELFLNYIWEFLGEIPYAYGLIIQGKTYNKDDLRGWLKDENFFPKAKTRALLKYAISLYKIRGTSLFYEILGRFYGINLQLVETNDLGIEISDLTNDRLFLAAYYSSESEDHLTVAVYPRSLEEIRAPYRDNNCTSCLYFKLVVKFDYETYNRLLSEGQLNTALDLLGSLVSKYLPIQVKLVNVTYTIISESEFDESFDSSFRIGVTN